MKRFKVKAEWFLPLTLADPYFIAIKAGIATSLSAAMSKYLADNPDLVSSCFIAIVAICPTPLLGLKSSFGQLLNSAIGGAWGLAMRAMGVDVVYGVGLAVALGIFCSFIARQSNFWVASAFSAYFVQVIDYGGVGETARVRALALSVGSVCAFAVNILTSLFFTKHMLGRRMQIAKNMVVRVLAAVGKEEEERREEARERERENAGDGAGGQSPQGEPRGGAEEEEGRRKRKKEAISHEEYFQLLDNLDFMSQSIFAVLNTLLGELSSVTTEAKILRKKFVWLELYIFRARKIKQLLHLAVNFAYEVQKAKEGSPLADLKYLHETSAMFFTHISHELSLIQVKNSKDKNSSKDGNSPKADGHFNVELRGVHEFPTEQIKRVAREMERLVEDIRNGSPLILNRSGEEPLLVEPVNIAKINETIPHDPHQFYKNVGSAEASISTSAPQS